MHLGLSGPISTANLEIYFDLKKGTLPECLPSTNVATIAKGLLKAGHKVTVYSLSSKVSNCFSFSLGNFSIYIGHYRPKHRARDLFSKEIAIIRDMVCKKSPDVIHANWSYEFAMGALESGIPALITFRDWAPMVLRFQPDLYRVARLILNNKVIKRSSFFTVNSIYLKELAEKKIKKKIALIPNPIDDSFFLSSTKNFDNHKIISVNNGFSKRKNVHRLLKAFLLVRKTLPNVELTLIGSDFESDGVAQKWAEKENIDLTNITFMGQVGSDMLIRIYDQSAILVHPSLEESFGNTLVEAMARKLPVIGGLNSGAVPWVLANGRAGLLTDVEKESRIAHSILDVLCDYNKWIYYSKSGFENAWNRFRLSKIISLYIEQYRELLKL